MAQIATLIIGFTSCGDEEAKLMIKGTPMQMQQMQLILEGQLPATMAWEHDVFEAVSYLMSAFQANDLSFTLMDSTKPKTEEHF